MKADNLMLYNLKSLFQLTNYYCHEYIHATFLACLELGTCLFIGHLAILLMPLLGTSSSDLWEGK